MSNLMLNVSKSTIELIHAKFQKYIFASHTWASLKESKGYPPEKIWIAAPLPQEGDSLAKYSPSFRKI